MITVIDASVFAYAFLGDSSHGDEPLNVLAKADEIHVPDLFFAEFSNTLWKSVAAKRLTLEAGLMTLPLCSSLITQAHTNSELWELASVLAYEHKHPAYDMHYVALARNLRTRVVTYDKRLVTKFPDDTIRPPEYLKG